MISAGFTLLHIFVNHVPRIEINVEWIEDEQPAAEETSDTETGEDEDDEAEGEENEDDDSDNDPDVSVVVGIVCSRN